MTPTAGKLTGPVNLTQNAARFRGTPLAPAAGSTKLAPAAFAMLASAVSFPARSVLGTHPKTTIPQINARSTPPVSAYFRESCDAPSGTITYPRASGFLVAAIFITTAWLNGPACVTARNGTRGKGLQAGGEHRGGLRSQLPA